MIRNIFIIGSVGIVREIWNILKIKIFGRLGIKKWIVRVVVGVCRDWKTSMFGLVGGVSVIKNGGV